MFGYAQHQAGKRIRQVIMPFHAEVDNLADEKFGAFARKQHLAFFDVVGSEDQAHALIPASGLERYHVDNAFLGQLLGKRALIVHFFDDECRTPAVFERMDQVQFSAHPDGFWKMHFPVYDLRQNVDLHVFLPAENKRGHDSRIVSGVAFGDGRIDADPYPCEHPVVPLFRYLRKIIVEAEPFGINGLLVVRNYIEHEFPLPCEFISGFALFRLDTCLVGVFAGPQDFPVLNKRVHSELAVQSAFRKIFPEAHQHRVFMQKVPDDHEPGIDVACRNDFSGHPFVRLIAPFAGLSRSEVFQVVADDEIGAVLVMAQPADALLGRYGGNPRIHIGKHERRRTPLIAFFLERTQVIKQQPVAFKLPPQVHHVLLGLALGLAEYKHELFLLLAQDSPDRIRGSEDGGFGRAAECDDEQVADGLVFGKTEHLAVHHRGRMLHVMVEVEMEEHEVALSGNSDPELAAAEHSSGYVFGDYLFSCFFRFLLHKHLHPAGRWRILLPAFLIPLPPASALPEARSAKSLPAGL